MSSTAGSPRRRAAVVGLLACLLAATALAGTARERGRKSKKARKAAAVEVPQAEAPPPGVPHAELEALVSRLLEAPERNEARASIVAIGRDATPYLLTRMKDPDFTVRWEMANVQGYIRDPRAIPALVENVLHDEDSHIRWRSIWALEAYPSDGETLRLLRTALASSSASARWNAAIGLSMFDAPDGLAIIHAGMAQADSWRRWEAINALGRIHDPSSVQHLAGALQRGDTRERSEVVMSLGRIGGAEAAEALIGALADPEPSVRWRACMQLGATGSANARAALVKLRATETDPTVLGRIDRIIGPAR